jgi:hypothetical protein
MEATAIEKKFLQMGARVRVMLIKPLFNRITRRDDIPGNLVVDIKNDKRGEYFDIRLPTNVDMNVADIQKDDKHLLLVAKRPGLRSGVSDTFRFLCGHDERNWFTCAVPGAPSSVFQAKQALKPQILQDMERIEGLKTANAHKRHRKLGSGRKIHRQGEFMFIPRPGMQLPKLAAIVRNEPMSRGGSGRGANPHIAEFMYRIGGMRMWENTITHVVMSDPESKAFMRQHPRVPLVERRANATAFVKGKITHSQHATVNLGDVWHEVVVNTENLAPGSRHVLFLD